jgi:riboflavin biosynthesis pyrimidine reductase
MKDLTLDNDDRSGLRVFACLATSLDGYLGPAGVDRYTRISSDADMEHLKRIRNQADVLLFGAETFRTFPVRHVAEDPGHFPLHLIMSRRVELDWSAPLFQEPALSVGIISPLAPRYWPGSVPRGILHLPISGEDAARDVQSILDWLQKNNYHGLLVEGGGHIMGQFLKAGRLQELYLTMTPTLIGQADAPRMISGDLPFRGGVQGRVLDKTVEEGDIFLHLELSYPEPDPE